MRQKLTVILHDEGGKAGRVVFKQKTELAPTEMTVIGLDPQEVIKLCILMHQLADMTIQNMATAKNERVMN